MDTMKEFGKVIRSEKDPVVMKRLIAVNLVEGGSSTEYVAKSVGVTQRIIQLWMERFRSYGIEGLRDLNREGRPSEAPFLLCARLQTSLGMLTPKKLRNWVRKRLGKKYSNRRLMRLFEMSPKTASFHLAHEVDRKEMAEDYFSEDFTPERTRFCGKSLG